MRLSSFLRTSAVVFALGAAAASLAAACTDDTTDRPGGADGGANEAATPQSQPPPPGADATDAPADASVDGRVSLIVLGNGSGGCVVHDGVISCWGDDAVG